MFDEVLHAMVDGTAGGLGGVVMGYDGIAIAQYFKPVDDADLQLIAVEYANILKEIRKAVEVLNTGDMEEVAIRTARFFIVVRPLTPEYFVALTLDRDGNFGKARYVLQRDRERLREALL